MENNEKELELMNENENRDFYVYKHIRLDNNTAFYIGKGKGNRIYVPSRNIHHDNICKRYGYEVVKIKENLTEEEAFALEREIIEDYVFIFGYGINIKGHDNYDHDLPYLTNFTWGGEGVSGMHHSEEAKKSISEASSGRNKGKNPYANKTLEEMEIIANKKSNSMKGKNKGKIPWNKGKKGLQHHSEETKQMMSEKFKGKYAGEKNGMWGKPSHNRSKVICITTGKIFDCQTDASNYYKCGNIHKCCKGKYKHAGRLQDGTPLQWKYVKDYNNEFKGILINPIADKRY